MARVAIGKAKRLKRINAMTENDIKKIPAKKLIALLQHAGASNFTAELLQADLEAGAPSNDDGTIDFVKYTAWIFERVFENAT